MMFFGLCLGSQSVMGLEIQPGIGVGATYTDNARLEPEDKVSDTIATTYVGANMKEQDGSLLYDLTASLRKENYLQDTYSDQRYLNLIGKAEWEAMRDRMNVYARDNFFQSPLRSEDADTPTNRQDTNEFVLGFDLTYPITGLQTFTLTPEYRQYYYEILTTDNRQYSLAADWHYQMFRTTGIGTRLTARKVLYDDPVISDVTFTTLAFILSGQRVHSKYTLNLGTTNVKRDESTSLAGDTSSNETAGFSGSANWSETLSSRSTLEALVSTNLTDTSTVSGSYVPGDPFDVQLSTDVIRNTVGKLSYLRDDEQLHSRIWVEYRKIRYSDNTDLNRLIHTFGAQLSFPVTQLVSSGVFVNFSDVNQTEIARDDKRFEVGVNVKATFTTRLHGVANVGYRTKESTTSTQNYDELRVFASLIYGFGSIPKPRGSF
jgi:hypothetical protein